MIREDRELLAQLARLGREMAPLAMRIMDGSASVVEQQNYALALIAAGKRLHRRADKTAGMIIEGEVLESEPLILLERTTQLYREP
jgi:hypothetical protein